MRKLRALFDQQRQSVWVDDLKRAWLGNGFLDRLVDAGVRGVTQNPTIFQRALAAGDDYDEQISELAASGSVEATYWDLAVRDVVGALEVLRPLHDQTEGSDGFVSLELAPDLAHDAAGSVRAAHELHERVAAPNLLVKVPATDAGVRAFEELVAAGRSINVTLVFGLRRYEQVVDAWFAGLERREGSCSTVASVASFFLSRVDTEVDARLEHIGSPEALSLRGTAANAQAKVAYQIFRERFATGRWRSLAKRGAPLQRPLWASTSTKNPEYPDLHYVSGLIGADTVSTMPEPTIAAFLDHGRIAATIEDGADEARATLERLEAVGVDLDDVAVTLEREGVARFQASYDELLRTIEGKTHALAG